MLRNKILRVASTEPLHAKKKHIKLKRDKEDVWNKMRIRQKVCCYCFQSSGMLSSGCK